MSEPHTASILACNEGGIGVDAMGLRLASSPATVDREGALGRGIGFGATVAPSEDEEISGMVNDGDDGELEVVGDGCRASRRVEDGRERRFWLRLETGYDINR